MKNFLRLIAILTLANPIILFAQDANPVDVNAVLKTLKEIQQKQQSTTQAEQLRLAQQFRGTAASISAATAYYEEAIRATKLEGQSGESIAFQAWKKASAERLKSKSFRDALIFHLIYLSITLRHGAGVEVKDLLPDLIAYTQQVIAEDGELAGQLTRQPKAKPSANNVNNPRQVAQSPLDNELMGQALTGSPFVKWLQIEKYVTADDDWESVPGQIDGIYEKTILPAFRLTKDPRLLQYWDQRIQREGESAGRSKLNYDVDQFNLIAKPKLLWLRAKELVSLGQKNHAVNDMLAIIKGFPAHPDLPDWISQTEELVKPAAPQTTPAAVPRAP